jgi:hypothetical protein
MPTTDIPAAVDTFARDTVEAAAMLRQMGVQKVALVGGSVGGLSVTRGVGRRGEGRRDRLPVGIRLDRGHRLAPAPPRAPRAASSSLSTALVCPSNDDFGALAARSPYDAGWASARGIPLPHQ